MNKKVWVVVLVVLIIVVAITTINYSASIPKTPMLSGQIEVPESTPVAEKTNIPKEFTATFEIYTNGTKRIFTAQMYHNLSEDVFISNPNPSIIYIKKNGVTWDDFFKTLPFSLTKDCLVTGTKETYCNTENKHLKFYLNEIETPDALNKIIQPEDSLRVVYGS